MFLPLTQTVEHAPYDGTQRDSRGNVIDSWGDPVSVKVYAWEVSSSHEPQIAGHDRLLVDARVFAPLTFRPAPRDHISLPTYGRFAVNGDVEDWNHGPFGFKPGYVVMLRKVTG